MVLIVICVIELVIIVIENVGIFSVVKLSSGCVLCCVCSYVVMLNSMFVFIRIFVCVKLIFCCLVVFVLISRYVNVLLVSMKLI